VVAVGQEDGAVGDDRVEGLGGGGAAGKRLQGPAAAGDPLDVRVPVGVLPDPAQVLGGVDGVGEVAQAEFESGALRVDVCVLEAGEQQLAFQVHDFGARADQLAHLVMADGDDPPVAYGHGGGAAAGGIDGVHGTAGQDEVRGG